MFSYSSNLFVGSVLYCFLSTWVSPLATTVPEGWATPGHNLNFNKPVLNEKEGLKGEEEVRERKKEAVNRERKRKERKKDRKKPALNSFL